MKKLLKFLLASEPNRPKKFHLQKFHRVGGTGGAILFLVVGAMAVLSILAVGATSSVLQEMKLARMITDSNTAPFIVPSVIKAMMVVWLSDTTPQTITLFDLRQRKFVLADKQIDVSFSDEQSKINIDNAPVEVLLRLPGLSGQVKLVNDIVAASIIAKEELLFLPDMTQEIYDAFKGLVTTYGVGSVNINTADPEIFSFLGIDNDLAEKIKTFVRGDDGQEATEDDRNFLDVQSIITVLEGYGLAQPQRVILENLVGTNQLGVQTENIRFMIEVKRASKSLKTFDVVVNKAQERIISWQEK